MALFDIFKKKKKKKPVQKTEKSTLSGPPPHRGEARQVRLGGKKISEVAFRVLQGPQVTEKATDLAKGNQYVFKVFHRASKQEIKRAIEDVYEVDVVSVKIVNIPRKARRLGRIEGWRKSHKKAIIKIKEGQKIEVLPR